MALKRCSHNQNEMQHLSELRIVLLGGRNSGKSFVGNAILNQEEFVLQERTTCVKREAQVEGRSVAVVDTPGWWCDFSAGDSPEMVRREIRRSVSLSLPGPHVFLLVVKTDSVFIEKRRRAIEEHVELLGETVWRHTLILFTKGKNSEDTSFEDYVKASGKPLQWLLEKCRGTFQVLDNHRTCNASQVMDLMRKIEQMVEGNRRHHFEMDEKTLQDIEDKRREVELMAHQRTIRILNQRATSKAYSCHLQNIRLVLLGAKGSGKTSTGNCILAAGSDIRFTANKRTVRCVMQTCTVAGRQLMVVDTPGWWMNYFTQDSSGLDKQEIVNSMYSCPPGPHAFILVVRVDRAFTKIYRRAVEEHMELVSQEIWRHTILLFSFGDWLGDTTIEQHIESEGEELQRLVERCEDRYHVLNNKSPGNRFQITELLEKIQHMTAGTDLRHFKTDKSVLNEIERKRQEEANRVKLRRENLMRKRQRLSAFKEHALLPTAIRLVLLGGKHSGKTSAAQCILGNEGKETGSLKPIRGSATVCEKTVEVVDTPGWKTERPVSEISRELLNDCETCVLLLVVNASSSFTSRNMRAAEQHLRALGEKAWSSTIVLFTHGDWLGEVCVEQCIESEGDALQTLVEKCGNRYHVFNSKIRDGGTQVAELIQKIDEMLIEQMLNSTVNTVSIERPFIHDELQFDRTAQTPSRSSTRASMQFGDTDISEELQTVGFFRQSPGTSGDLKMTNTQSRLSQSENQALACRTIRLHNRSLCHRNISQRLILLLNTSEWPHQNQPFIGVNRTERSDFPSLAVLSVTPADQQRHEICLLSAESQKERFCERSCLQHQRCAPGQTAKEKAFVNFVQSGSLQDLIDQWGDSDIEELEAFIDAYFEMMWQETIKEAKTDPESSNTTSINCKHSVITETGLEYLASIDRKLSKLDILEEIQEDLKQLKQNLQIFQELKVSSKDPPVSSEQSEGQQEVKKDSDVI